MTCIDPSATPITLMPSLAFLAATAKLRLYDLSVSATANPATSSEARLMRSPEESLCIVLLKPIVVWANALCASRDATLVLMQSAIGCSSVKYVCCDFHRRPPAVSDHPMGAFRGQRAPALTPAHHSTPVSMPAPQQSDMLPFSPSLSPPKREGARAAVLLLRPGISSAAGELESTQTRFTRAKSSQVSTMADR
jgi:hypothetical protein